ncbi:MAG: hypothetical protein IJJ00_04650 [Erysipelotrichaceae bacterium]|nr:hypothetical protein [Erysipelotrichaceae bacterium]
MITELKEEAKKILAGYDTEEIPDERYAHLKYPKLAPLMYFDIERFRIKDFGHLMIMHTTSKVGMELLTMSFMPDGVTLPFLLLDAMTMKKKRCVYAEYYGCGQEGLSDERLFEVYEKYKGLEDYDEKPAWYVKERRPYSLIKGGEEEELLSMALDSIRAYLDSIKDAEYDPEYREKLKAFRERMIVEGNPASKTMEMLFKKEGARTFVEEAVMPISE